MRPCSQHLQLSTCNFQRVYLSSRYSVSILETSSCAKLSSSTVWTRRVRTSQLYPNMEGMAVACVRGRSKFESGGLVSHEKGAAVGLDTPIADIKDAFLSAIFGVEEEVEFFGAAHLDGFEDHRGPGDDREDGEEDDDDFCFRRGLLPHIKQLRGTRVGGRCG